MTRRTGDIRLATSREQALREADALIEQEARVRKAKRVAGTPGVQEQPGRTSTPAASAGVPVASVSGPDAPQAHPGAERDATAQTTASGEVASGQGWGLRLGDCIEGMRALADDSVDVVITDPPYSDATHNRTWQAKTIGRPTVYQGIDFAALTPETAHAAMREFARLSRRWVIAFTDLENIDLWRHAVLDADLEYVRCGIWVKPDATPQFTGDRPAQGAEAFVIAHRSGKKRWNGGGKRNVYTHMREPGGNPHPTTKPLQLMRDLVADFSDPNELILDPFSGSGSTGVACRQLGRRFLGFELNRDYFDIACRRLRGDEAKPRPEQPSLFDAIGGTHA